MLTTAGFSAGRRAAHVPPDRPCIDGSDGRGASTSLDNVDLSYTCPAGTLTVDANGHTGSLLHHLLSGGRVCTFVPEPWLNSSTNLDFNSSFNVVQRSTAQQQIHVVDGAFTGWEVSGSPSHEWSGVTPARGKLLNGYFYFDGFRLHILIDWQYNDAQPVLESCYVLFNVWSGGGKERWVLHVYGVLTYKPC